MAIVVDERARSAVSRRHGHRLDARIFLHVEQLRGRARALAGNPEVLAVGWVPQQWPLRPMVARIDGGVAVIMETRIARYSQEHDLTISAWHRGPNDHLTVDPEAILAMQEWERTRLHDQEPPTVSPAAARTYARPVHLDGSGASARTVHLADVRVPTPTYGDEERTRPTSVPSVAAGEAGE